MVLPGDFHDFNWDCSQSSTSSYTSCSTTDHTDELDAAPSKGKGKRKRRNKPMVKLDQSHQVIRAIFSKKKPTQDEMRHVISLLLAVLFYKEKCFGRKKIRNMWKQRPAGYRPDVTFKDPNNRTKENGVHSKPKQTEVIEMYNYLKKLYCDKYGQHQVEEAMRQPTKEQAHNSMYVIVPKVTSYLEPADVDKNLHYLMLQRILVHQGEDYPGMKEVLEQITSVLNNLYEKNMEAYLSAVKNIDSLTLSATTKEEDWGKLFEDCKNFLNIITIRYDTSGNDRWLPNIPTVVTDLENEMDNDDDKPDNSEIYNRPTCWKDILSEAMKETGLPEVSTVGLTKPDVVSTRAYIPSNKTENSKSHESNILQKHPDVSWSDQNFTNEAPTAEAELPWWAVDMINNILEQNINAESMNISTRPSASMSDVAPSTATAKFIQPMDTTPTSLCETIQYLSGDESGNYSTAGTLPGENLANIMAGEDTCSYGSNTATSVNSGVLDGVSVYPLCEESQMQM